MKKSIFSTILFLTTFTSTYSQVFDTLNFIDNFSKYVSFLDTASTLKVCQTFKTSKYFDHKIDRPSSKGYPEYALNDDYYNKFKISEVDFVSFCEVDTTEDYLRMFSFYSLVKDSTFISNKLVTDGWEKQLWPPDVAYKDQKMLFRKLINDKNYIIENQRFPDESTYRYYLSFHDDEYGIQKLEEKNRKLALITQTKDSIASLLPIDTIKGVYYAKTDYDAPVNYTGAWEYHKGGKLIQKANYKLGKLDGEFVEYYNNSKIHSKCFYSNGNLNGEYLSYYDNGKLMEKLTYKNMKSDGYREVYFQSGAIMSSSFYSEGKQLGEFKSYWENGQLAKKVNFKNGIPIGEEIQYTNRGTILQKGNYKNGLQDGEWITYNDDGTIISKAIYQEGILISEE